MCNRFSNGVEQLYCHGEALPDILIRTIEANNDLYFAISIGLIQSCVQVKTGNVESGQSVNHYRAVYASQTVSHIITRRGKPFGSGGNLHFEVEPVRVPDFHEIGYFPFNWSIKVLSVSQQLSIQPVVSPAVNGFKTKEYPVSDPPCRNSHLFGQNGNLVAWYVIPLLRPLTWHLEMIPVRGIQGLLPDALTWIGINAPRTIECYAVPIPESNNFASHRTVTHRFKNEIPRRTRFILGKSLVCHKFLCGKDGTGQRKSRRSE